MDDLEAAGELSAWARRNGAGVDFQEPQNSNRWHAARRAIRALRGKLTPKRKARRSGLVLLRLNDLGVHHGFIAAVGLATPTQELLSAFLRSGAG
jgi:hypothetical protein